MSSNHAAKFDFPGKVPNCDKCGQQTILLNVIQRLGLTPTYRIFECKRCDLLKWVQNTNRVLRLGYLYRIRQLLRSAYHCSLRTVCTTQARTRRDNYC